MEKTVAQKLEALLKLQNIDSKQDEIKKVRGDLPDEVQDLEDEIIGYNTRIEKFHETIRELEKEITSIKANKKEAEKLIQKYKEQQMNVKNNREFDALSKEIESEELEMVLCDKRVKEYKDKIEGKRNEIELVSITLDDRKKDLAGKQKELELLMEESNEEEEKLLKEREKHVKTIEERLLASYEKIRKNASNGLAVVMVKRDACGGCFNVVPPQRQVDIKERKKLIVCEHCGRIFAGVEEHIIEEKPKRGSRTTTKTVAKAAEEAEGE